MSEKQPIELLIGPPPVCARIGPNDVVDKISIVGITGRATEVSWQLLVAAPDLLAACEAADLAVQAMKNDAPNASELGDKAWRLMYAAIAKAKGTS